MSSKNKRKASEKQSRKGKKGKAEKKDDEAPPPYVEPVAAAAAGTERPPPYVEPVAAAVASSGESKVQYIVAARATIFDAGQLSPFTSSKSTHTSHANYRAVLYDHKEVGQVAMRCMCHAILSIPGLFTAPQITKWMSCEAWTSNPQKIQDEIVDALPAALGTRVLSFGSNCFKIENGAVEQLSVPETETKYANQNKCSGSVQSQLCV